MCHAPSPNLSHLHTPPGFSPFGTTCAHPANPRAQWQRTRVQVPVLHSLVDCPGDSLFVFSLQALFSSLVECWLLPGDSTQAAPDSGKKERLIVIVVVLISSLNLCMGNANGGKYPCKYSDLCVCGGAEAVFG